MFDEIHSFPQKDFKGGNVVSHAHDSTDAASSAYAFMINSLRSVYKEVVGTYIFYLQKLLNS